ncbi:3-hydroxyacyl-CoA dehydrogenase family protein [Phytoactinopolyspora alkaliphila]|uniref:3-hydroxyacyl-CoA dehydrogenase family protein n=1 Tax=Phytoactinopolyspora alkaliphila TaxID=1783498 RepID=A0A6N9YI98_9ACTN|nr:3-hydroxyacyl-CoA dehydrogenase family protein [Phytoactinopolyspora alkaliphila]NED94677.1 3-hydroxyacyl-CoA dehydrogenase family protein [Phytoactinopolyspora alkaliphila]
MAVPETVAVVGGGTMGAGITHVFAAAGARVTVVESDETAGEAARVRIAGSLERAAGKGKLGTGVDEVWARVDLVAGIAHLPRDADLVVEAVPETPDLKANVLAAVERIVGERTVLASNTSSLSITELAAVLDDPSRFLGMHFFNPVPASRLVEIVGGQQTAAEVRDRVVDWVRALGKTEVVVRDSPGFATSRLGVALGLEAIRMLEEGVADAEAIDTAMELGYRHPMGPLRSTDVVGLDVRLAIAEYLNSKLGDRFEPPRLLRDKVARGELGRKTGQGFYRWEH